MRERDSIICDQQSELERLRTHYDHAVKEKLECERELSTLKM